MSWRNSSDIKINIFAQTFKNLNELSARILHGIQDLTGLRHIQLIGRIHIFACNLFQG
jgi:hypothetical protein